jgi:ATP-binding cassette subfamily F protein uup
MVVASNLVNLKDVEKGYAARSVLRGVTLGVDDGDRIGVVGGNGEGKSTLLRLLAGAEEPDAGTVTRPRGLTVASLGQGDDLDPARRVREAVVGDRADHEWQADAALRSVLAGLLGGVALDASVATLSGGERRRVSIARLLLDRADLLLLDEPTNHLDVEGVDWLARHLAARRGALVLVTHDRWFLDAVCTATWEVADGAVHRYEGAYAAYVLARAERARQAAATEERRQGLLRKELAWLRRGPPARTSKPKFRIDAANALIADEPAPRDSVELLRFASSRLGDRVLDAVDVTIEFGPRTRLLERATWRIGPGDRLALVGVNGSGKSSLLRVLAGIDAPAAGSVQRGQTVRLAFLSQEVAEIPGDRRVLEALEDVRGEARLAAGAPISAGQLAERFGFRGEKARTLVRDLSGGERRRLQLMRLLMDEPNVLILDEPTNDLDIDTLTALEDLLDGWPGTLVFVSHDRYFVERVSDDVHALMGDRTLRHLPGGIDQYLQGRRPGRDPGPPPSPGGAKPPPDQATRRASRKELARVERALDRLGEREAALHDEMARAASDHVQLAALQRDLEALAAERDQLEAAWLELSERLDP